MLVAEHFFSWDARENKAIARLCAALDDVVATGAGTGAGLCVVCVACRCIHATAAIPPMSTTANAQNHALGPLRFESGLTTAGGAVSFTVGAICSRTAG